MAGEDTPAQPLDPKANIEVSLGGEPHSEASRENVQVQAAPEDGDPETPFAIVGDRKFASQEELSKWWDEQRNASTEDSAAGAAEDSLKGGDGNDAVRTDEEIVASLKEAGGIYADERYQPFALEFEKTGGLSEESVKKAAEAFAIPEDFVKQFVEGQKAMRTAPAAEANAGLIALGKVINEVVQEEGQYEKLLEWGKDAIPADQQQAYNAALDRTDAVTAKLLLQGFWEQFKEAGHAPGPKDATSGLSTSGGAAKAAEPYSSSAEMQADMNKPEYQTDARFRKQVEQRIAVSNI